MTVAFVSVTVPVDRRAAALPVNVAASTVAVPSSSSPTVVLLANAGWSKDDLVQLVGSATPDETGEFVSGQAYQFTLQVGGGMIRWRQAVPFTP